VDNLRLALETVCEQRGWGVVEVYADNGVSGAKGRNQRSGPDALLKDASRGRFNVVVALALDRLGRPPSTLPRKRAASSSGSNGITIPNTEVGSTPAFAGACMAEIELSVLSTQCLDRRIPDKAMLTEEVAAWQAERNNKRAKADWQFTTADARVKLKRLYPST
jgi:uncharacterized small protein (DUF1192 family)